MFSGLQIYCYDMWTELFTAHHHHPPTTLKMTTDDYDHNPKIMAWRWARLLQPTTSSSSSSSSVHKLVPLSVHRCLQWVSLSHSVTHSVRSSVRVRSSYWPFVKPFQIDLGHQSPFGIAEWELMAHCMTFPLNKRPASHPRNTGRQP